MKSDTQKTRLSSLVFLCVVLIAFVFSSYRDNAAEQKPDDAFREVIASCRSLSSYEPNNIKTALPQVSIVQ